MTNLKVLLLLPVPLFLFGCGENYNPPASAAAYYYRSPVKRLSDIGRVAIIELSNDSSYPQISTDVTKLLYQELQKKQVFGLTLVHQNDPAWRSLQLDVTSRYTPEQLLAIRSALKCDAVLIGTVTQYQPYPHIVIGLRMKLLDLNDGQLLWALEQIWDGADKATELRIKNYFKSQIFSDSAPLSEQLFTVSSIKFIKFVASEAAGTL